MHVWNDRTEYDSNILKIRRFFFFFKKNPNAIVGKSEEFRRHGGGEVLNLQISKSSLVRCEPECYRNGVPCHVNGATVTRFEDYSLAPSRTPYANVAKVPLSLTTSSPSKRRKSTLTRVPPYGQRTPMGVTSRRPEKRFSRFRRRR